MNPIEPIEQETQTESPQEKPEQAPREWIEPTFERMTLKEAMTSTPGPNAYTDLPYDYS